MLLFEEYFSSDDLRMGYHDFCSKAMSKFQIHNSSYEALIQKKYQVHITLEHDTLVDMDCDCIDGNLYGTCRHIAALCYALENGSILLDHQKKKAALHHRLDKMNKK